MSRTVRDVLGQGLIRVIEFESGRNVSPKIPMVPWKSSG
ncbi:hypothetical protein LG3211_4895 [Lysobacter gummosus]|nr:hypothetical protein LG3211_4895 [Lysobacter gummosus]